MKKDFYKGKNIVSCYMCDNAKINSELTDDNDASMIGVGKCTQNFRMMLCSGWGKPLRIDVEQWNERTGWYVIGRYEPKFCPNCGRKIVEYEVVDDFIEPIDITDIVFQ